MAPQWKPYTLEDDLLLVRYLATEIPTVHGRKTESRYDKLASQEGSKWPGGDRHTASSWRSHYRAKQTEIDERVREYQQNILGQTSSTSSSSSMPPRVYIRFTAEEDDNLVNHLAKNNPTGIGRTASKLYQTLGTDEMPWSKRHSSQSWKSHYRNNRAKFDAQIEKRIQELADTPKRVRFADTIEEKENVQPRPEPTVKEKQAQTISNSIGPSTYTKPLISPLSSYSPRVVAVFQSLMKTMAAIEQPDSLPDGSGIRAPAPAKANVHVAGRRLRNLDQEAETSLSSESELDAPPPRRKPIKTARLLLSSDSETESLVEGAKIDERGYEQVAQRPLAIAPNSSPSLQQAVADDEVKGANPGSDAKSITVATTPAAPGDETTPPQSVAPNLPRKRFGMPSLEVRMARRFGEATPDAGEKSQSQTQTKTKTLSPSPVEPELDNRLRVIALPVDTAASNAPALLAIAAPQANAKPSQSQIQSTKPVSEFDYRAFLFATSTTDCEDDDAAVDVPPDAEVDNSNTHKLRNLQLQPMAAAYHPQPLFLANLARRVN